MQAAWGLFPRRFIAYGQYSMPKRYVAGGETIG